MNVKSEGRDCSARSFPKLKLQGERTVAVAHNDQSRTVTLINTCFKRFYEVQLQLG